MHRYPRKPLIPYPPPTETRCWRVTIPDDPAWSRAFFSQLEELGIWIWWDRDGEKTATKIAKVWRDVYDGIVPCDEGVTVIDFRQTGCVLEYSKDEGETWLPAFDYSLCFPSVDDAARGTAAQNLLQEVHRTNTPRDIDPNAPRDTFNSDPDDTGTDGKLRTQALCYACAGTIAWFAELAIKRRDDSLTVPNVVAQVLGIAAGILGIFSGQVWLTLGLTLASGATSIATSAWSWATQQVARDAAAQQELACIMFDALRDVALSQAAFSASLNAPDPTNANAGLAVGAYRAVLNDPRVGHDAYITFLALCGEGFSIAQIDDQALGDCPCNCDPVGQWESVTFGDWTNNVGIGAAVPGNPDSVHAFETTFDFGGRVPIKITFEWRTAFGAWPVFNAGSTFPPNYDNVWANFYQPGYSPDDWTEAYAIPSTAIARNVEPLSWFSRFRMEVRNVVICYEE